MIKFFKVAGIALGGIFVLIAGVVIYYQATWRPVFSDTPHPQVEASADPDVIARGKYLFHAVAHCTHCHAPLEEHWGSAPEHEALPRGGTRIPMGPLGTFLAPNITPDRETGVGSWSDGDLARVIVHAIRPDDTPALLMLAAGPVNPADVAAMISYMRTLPPVRHAVPESDPGVMGKVMLQTVARVLASPKPPLPVPPYVPEGEVSVERGRYLAEGPAFCISCHSEIDEANFEIARPFAGGKPEPDPWNPGMEFRASNLTPDPQTGHMASWSEEDFIERFRAGRVIETSFMPWDNYQKLTEADLRSVYRYLRTVEPIQNATGPRYRQAGWMPGDE